MTSTVGQMTTLELVSSISRLQAAWEQVRRGGPTPGVDRVGRADFDRVVDMRLPELAEEIQSGAYTPQPLRRIEISKPDGGVRFLSLPTIEDRVVQRALLDSLEPVVDPEFSDRSFGFRPGRSTVMALKSARGLVRKGLTWVVDLDLEKFFDLIPHDQVLKGLGRLVNDRRVLNLIREIIRTPAIRRDRKHPGKIRRRGVPQGGPLSPLLGNVVLDVADRHLEHRGIEFVRYADDLRVFVRDEREAWKAYDSARHVLEQRLGLRVNGKKTYIGPTWNRRFLGFALVEENGSPVIRVSEEAWSSFFRNIALISQGRHYRSGPGYRVGDPTPRDRGEVLYSYLVSWYRAFRPGITQQKWQDAQRHALSIVNAQGLGKEIDLDNKWPGGPSVEVSCEEDGCPHPDQYSGPFDQEEELAPGNPGHPSPHSLDRLSQQEISHY